MSRVAYPLGKRSPALDRSLGPNRPGGAFAPTAVLGSAVRMWHRYLSRDGAVLVESVCSGVHWRDQEAARRPAQLVELALAS